MKLWKLYYRLRDTHIVLVRKQAMSSDRTIEGLRQIYRRN